MRAMPPVCQMCGSKDGSVLFMDLWVLCPECWVTANGQRRRESELADETPELHELASPQPDDPLDQLEDILAKAATVKRGSKTSGRPPRSRSLR